MARRVTPKSIQEAVLVACGRRCCMCFGLQNDLGIKRGQIAHLDRNPGNNQEDNLAFLCLDHHDEYDSRSSQSKGLTIGEVKAYRGELIQRLGAENGDPKSSVAHPLLDEEKRANARLEAQAWADLKAAVVEILSSLDEPFGVGTLSTRLGMSPRRIESVLGELVSEGVLRMDRAPGSVTKRYSLPTSMTNRHLDAFLGQLTPPILSEIRHLRGPRYKVDAMVETGEGVHLVRGIFNDKDALPALRDLREASRRLNTAGARLVLVFASDGGSTPNPRQLSWLSDQGALIRIVNISDAADESGREGH